ncbi:accessory Sec system glycosyltransferase GtfA [Macrococcoides caseolyticum]|uniref:accessory Sec system glycosyltransferase GtfA n=1 Tax=Macrococcoides caseolyticum TaxID=69966 RepID=UPI001F1F082B|nr:accessory Sec system glycosyltransferase GtfA [Macrococcus caseolyticus]MCE4957555.1 accessory Sec system glycosyltransferase GtfA [Macrococcus caseolyticus]
MLYNINFGIGWASSGVEYAQSYRARMIRDLNIEQKYVFLDFISAENIQTLTHNLNYEDHEIIWLYQYFTDIPIAPTSYTLQDVLNSIASPIDKEERSGKIVRYFYGNQFATCYLKNEEASYVDRVEFVVDGLLVRKDYFSYTRLYSEYFVPVNQTATIYMRQFYNEDGSIAYNEYIRNNTSVFKIHGQTLFGKTAFVDYFMQCLQLSEDDTVIIDRATDLGEALFRHVGNARLGVVIHAEHFSENATDDEFILWNNHYEYQFNHHDKIDFFITATKRQADILSAQFQKYYQASPRIEVIPVGSLDELKTGERKPFSIMTASRLASEKNIDWLIEAVAQCKSTLPEITFDIYGEGGERQKLQELIQSLGAQDYIHLKGHHHLDDCYCKYALFLTGSTSEGFGLTLMEAVGSGLGMIGLDVNYGNPTFITHEGNGYLIPYKQHAAEISKVIDLYVHYIHAFFKHQKDFSAASYTIAEQFKTSVIKEKWRHLLIGEV